MNICNDLGSNVMSIPCDLRFLGLTYLKKSLEILQFESEGTLQKSIYNGSKDSAVKLEEFIDSVFGSYSES